MQDIFFLRITCYSLFTERAEIFFLSSSCVHATNSPQKSNDAPLKLAKIARSRNNLSANFT